LALAFSADGRHLASSDREGAVFLWDLARPAAAPAALSAGSAATSALDFNAEGDTLASASAEGIRVWRIDDPRGAPTVIPAGFVTAVAFSRDGRRLASGGPISSYVRLWDLAPGGRPRVLSGHAGSGVQSLAFSADGTLLASGGGTGDGTIRLWRWDELDAAPRVLSGHRGTVSSLQFSADDTQLLSASWNDSAILLWDLGKSSPTHTALRVPERMLPYMARFGPDGDTVAASGRGGLHTWRRGNLDAEPELVQPFKGWATEMAYSPGGDRVALGGSRVTTIYLKSLTRPDAPARELVVRGDPSDTWSVAFSPDGQWLASGGKTDPTVRLWNLRARDAASIVLGQHDEAVTRVRFSPDGRQLASASQDYTVRLWDVGRLEATPIVLSGHEGEVWSLAYSPDGTHLVAGGRDKMIRIWDLTHPRNASPTPTIADEVCRKVWRNLTLQEWHKFVSVELPYERTCPNLPVHPSLVEAAEKKATAGDIEAAVSLYRRAVELQPELGIQPELEAARVASEAQ
jgi:WD40 repeat protein